MVERFGVEHPTHRPGWRETYKATLKENYGVEHPFYSPELLAKRHATCLIRHGNIWGVGEEAKLKKIAGLLERFGVVNVFQLAEVQEKARETSLLRYGTVYPMQYGLVFRRGLRASFRSKLVTLPSGRVISLQGYEPQILLELLQTYPESAFEFETIPTIPYQDPATGKSRAYHPDFFIPTLNLLIEVKSDWTLLRDYEVARAKQAAAIAAGYSFAFHVRASAQAPTKIITERLPAIIPA